MISTQVSTTIAEIREQPMLNAAFNNITVDIKRIVALSRSIDAARPRYGAKVAIRKTNRPVYLTPDEATHLLTLCVASPLSGHPCEESLFAKLSDAVHGE
jgi:hypothetical protein